MNFDKTEGIILGILDFQERDQIISVYSREFGLIKLIVKGAKSPNKQALTPLSQAEFVFKRGKSDLWNCREISFINLFFGIRASLDLLDTGCKLIHAIQKSQMGEEPSPILYQLLISYLNRLVHSSNPRNLQNSFQMKLLRYESLFSIDQHCSACQIPLADAYHRWGNEIFCDKHAPQGSILFNEEEAKKLIILAYSQNYQELEELEVSESLSNKIIFIFNNS